MVNVSLWTKVKKSCFIMVDLGLHRSFTCCISGWVNEFAFGYNSRRAGICRMFCWDAGILSGEIFISVAKEYQLLLARDFDCRLSAGM